MTENDAISGRPPEEIRHLAYRIQFVYQQLTPGLRNEIIVFWLDAGALTDIQQAKQRVEQVVCVVRSPEGSVVGVSTVFPSRFDTDGQLYLNMRMFIHSAHRVTNLMREVTHATRELFNDNPALRLGTRGMLIFTENPKLMRPGARRQFQRDGWTYAGIDSRGIDVWKFVFTNVGTI